MNDNDSRPENDEPHDPSEREEGSFARVIPDLFKRALMTGIGTVFMTEEGIKNALSDLKMPKEAYGYVVAQADRTKRELIATLARELRTFLDGLELDELVKRSFEDTTFEINTTITVRRAEDGGRKAEVVKRTTKIRRGGADDESGDEDSPAAEEKEEKKAKRKRKTTKRARKSKRSSSADEDTDTEQS